MSHYAIDSLKKIISPYIAIEEAGWERTSKHVPDPLINVLSIPEEFAETLDRMRYSRATKENYLSQFKIFLSFIYPKTAEEIDQSIIQINEELANDLEFYAFIRYEAAQQYYGLATKNFDQIVAAKNDLDMDQLFKEIEEYLDKIYEDEAE